MSYWLSYDELLILAACAQINLAVVGQQEDGFPFRGEHIADENLPVVVTSIRMVGALGAVETHFECLATVLSLGR